MDGLKKMVTTLVLMVLLAAGAAQAMAQDSSDTMAQGSSDTQGAQGMQTEQQTRQAQQGQTTTEDLWTIVENNPDLSAYAEALKASGNDQKLAGEVPYMVFAPTDQAIKRDLGETKATELSSAGKYLLEGTIVKDPKAPAEKTKQATLTSINGKRIDVTKSDSQVMVNGVKVTNAIPATNGILVITDGIV